MTGLDWLPQRVRDAIEAAAPAIERALADQLIAVCLIGPAAKPTTRNLRGTQAELLVVAKTLELDTMRALASSMTTPLREGLQIRTVTGAELAGSVDVHALEIAQWRDHHQLIAGRNPFAALDVTTADLRHEIERALRSLSQRLRNRLLWCLATEQRRLDSVLREGLELLTMLAHHTLAMVNEQPPSEEEPLLERFASWSGTPAEPILALRERLEAGRVAEDSLAELAALAATTEAACVCVDRLRV